MTDETLRLAFNLACEERDRAKKRTADLEALVMDLRVKNQQLETRLRIVELMEEQAANRWGFQTPLRLVGDVSEEQFSMLVREHEGAVQ